MREPRKTHPSAPIYFPQETTIEPEDAAQINIDFTQLTGQIADGQVPLTAVTQYESDLDISFTQMIDDPTPTQIATVLDDADLTGTPTAPTATPGDNSTQVATTEYVDAAVAAGGGGGAPSRGDVSVTTGSLADGATEAGVITLGKSSLIIRFTASCQCRIRLYSTSAWRTADAARPPGTDPTGEHGVMLDINLPTGTLDWDLSPLSLVTNDDGPPVADIYYAIQNKSGSAAAVTATLTRITLES